MIIITIITIKQQSKLYFEVSAHPDVQLLSSALLRERRRCADLEAWLDTPQLYSYDIDRSIEG